MQRELVAGRNCGECSVCCTDLLIDSKEFQKLPGVPCRHLCAGGCAIYETRYATCRHYYCGWRYMHVLGDAWRPDKSRVVLDFVPAGKDSVRPSLTVFLIGRPPSEIMRSLCQEVARLIAAGVKVELGVPGPAGHRPAHWILNESLEEAAAKDDLAYIEGAFSEALALIDVAADRFIPVVFKHGKQSSLA
jgi:hypothetical protein